MENASKALLIAGAVLIAIFIISLALVLVRSNSDVMDDGGAALNSAAATAYNSRFLSYVNQSTTASRAKSLTSQLLQHNTASDSYNSFTPGKHIYLNFYPKGKSSITHKWKSSDLSIIYNSISNSGRYRIYTTSCTAYTGGYYNGYLVCISIREL